MYGKQNHLGFMIPEILVNSLVILLHSKQTEVLAVLFHFWSAGCSCLPTTAMIKFPHLNLPEAALPP